MTTALVAWQVKAIAKLTDLLEKYKDDPNISRDLVVLLKKAAYLQRDNVYEFLRSIWTFYDTHKIKEIREVLPETEEEMLRILS